MTARGRRRELGRGERVLPGLWRLRLPLPWPGVPHCNAWALAAGDGIVLVDCGMHEPGSLAHLERALEQVNLSLEHVRLLACTHAHSDHYGQAAAVLDRSGCELWMHPDHAHTTRAAQDPERGAGAPTGGGAPERRSRGAPPALVGVPARPGLGDRADRRARLTAGRGHRDRDRPRHLDHVRDARARALSRLPLPARAAAADLRRPPPGTGVALLRLRLDPGPGRGVPALARRGGRPGRPPVRGRPRPALRRRARPRGGQPGAGGRAPGGGTGGAGGDGANRLRGGARSSTARS